MGKPRPSWILRQPPDPRMGLLIKAARRAQRLTIAQLAERASLSPRYISRLQAGERTPTGETARAIGQVLGVEIPLPPAPPRRETRHEKRARVRRESERQAAMLDELQEMERQERLSAQLGGMFTNRFRRRF